MPTVTTIIVAASIWALSATAAAAAPDQSILDAYAGQAAVLGKPAHVHQTSASPGAKLSPTPPSGGSQARNRGSNNAAGSASGVAPGPPGPRGGGGGPRHGGAAPRGSGPLPSRASASPALSVPSTAAPDLELSALHGSGASLPFNWIDALALAAGGLGLALVGLSIRRLARTPV
jgi:hypothetical protein